MDELLSVVIVGLIDLLGSAVVSFLVARFYGERWVEARRSRKEHSVKLKDDFLKPLFATISSEFCKIEAHYSKMENKMIPSKPREPDNLSFYSEAMSHLKEYKEFLKAWEDLKQTTLKLNTQLATLFEEIRTIIIKDIDLPYWCPQYSTDDPQFSGDEPDEYLCPNDFTRSIYDEIYWRIKLSRKKYYGNATIIVMTAGEKKFYELTHGSHKLARSLNEELMKKAQHLFNRFIEDKEYWQKIKTFIDEEETDYDKKLDEVQRKIKDIVKSIELGNIIKGNCEYCPKK
jgi:hypothetical protein